MAVKQNELVSKFIRDLAEQVVEEAVAVEEAAAVEEAVAVEQGVAVEPHDEGRPADVEIAGEVEQSPAPRLSCRERQVGRLVAGCLRNKEIAHELTLTIGTVRVYLSRLYGKLGIPSYATNSRMALGLMVGEHPAWFERAGDQFDVRRSAAAAPKRT